MGTLFSFTPGSAGTGNEAYSIRLMFFLSPGRTLKIEDISDCTLLGQNCHIKGDNNQYLMTAGGFTTEGAALSFLQKMCAGLIWYGIKNSTGIKFTSDITPIETFDKPIPASENPALSKLFKDAQWDAYDGHYDFDKTSIIPEHMRLIQFSLGSVTARIDTPLENLAKVVSEGMELPFPERTLTHQKFRLASEVYLSSHFESSPGASFLSRISTLEILAPDTPSSDPIRELVKRFVEEAKSAQASQESQEIQKEYQSLVSRLDNLLNRSIKSRIRDLVIELLNDEFGANDAAKAAKSSSQLYDLRSTMVHSGEVDADKIRDGNNKLNELVPTLLRVIYRKLAE